MAQTIPGGVYLLRTGDYVDCNGVVLPREKVAEGRKALREQAAAQEEAEKAFQKQAQETEDALFNPMQTISAQIDPEAVTSQETAQGARENNEPQRESTPVGERPRKPIK